KGETVWSCRNTGAFGLEDGEILCQELHFAGRQGAGGDSPDMADFMIGQDCTIRCMLLTLRQLQALLEPLGEAKLRLHLKDQPMFLIFLCGNLMSVPTFFQ